MESGLPHTNDEQIKARVTMKISLDAAILSSLLEMEVNNRYSIGELRKSCAYFNNFVGSRAIPILFIHNQEVRFIEKSNNVSIPIISSKT